MSDHSYDIYCWKEDEARSWTYSQMVTSNDMKCQLTWYMIHDTPGVTHFWAYHRPPDGHFLALQACRAKKENFWELVLKFKELFKSDVGWTYLSFFSTYQIIGPICLRAWVCKSLQNSGNATKQGIFQISSHLLCGEILNSLTCWGMWWYLATFLIFMHPQYFQAFQLCTEVVIIPARPHRWTTLGRIHFGSMWGVRWCFLMDWLD